MRADDATLDLLFNNAISQNGWQDRPLPDGALQEIWNLTRMGPTSANCSPARIVFVSSPEAKEKLKPAMNEGNVAKVMAAPTTAIIGTDMEFYEKLPQLFPHTDARSWFAGDGDKILDTASRNGTLQGAYFMIAARAIGLDCGPLSGFDKARVDELFFAGTPIKSNFLCSIGYGDESQVFERSPRLSFDEACRVE